MATLPSPLEVNLPGRILARTGLASQIPGASLRLGEVAFTTDDSRLWVGDESQSPPWVLTSKTTGNIDFTNINPTFNNIKLNTINGSTLSQIIAGYLAANNYTPGGSGGGGGGGGGGGNSNIQSQIPLCQPNNLYIDNSGTAPNTNINITADELVLNSAANLTIRLINVSVSINNTVTGAGGIDVGTVAASTAYDEYVGYNPTTSSAVAWATIEGNTPTVPTGVVYYRRVGWNRTDVSRNWYRIVQTGDEWHYKVQGQSGVNTKSPPVVVSGAVGTDGQNIAAAVYQPISLVGLFPIKTIRADFIGEGLALSFNQSLLAPNANYGVPSAAPSPNSLLYSSTQDNNQGGISTALQMHVMLEQQANGLPTVYCAQQTNCVVGAIGGKIRI